jgi:hypothetical protein
MTKLNQLDGLIEAQLWLQKAHRETPPGPELDRIVHAIRTTKDLIDV